MRYLYLIAILYILLLLPVDVFCQKIINDNNTTSYDIETFGSASSGKNTPFWTVSNRYGVVPLKSGNGYIRAAIDHSQMFNNGLQWNAGLDLVTASPRDRNVFVQQIYAEVSYKPFLLSIGSKEKYNSILDKNLSSGDMVLSPNARPIPEINISIPEFTAISPVKWLYIKGDFAVGKSFDESYLKRNVEKGTNYVEDVLWHHKSFFAKIKTKDNPYSAIIGVEHWVQWGGESPNSYIGKQPSSFKDFLRVVVGQEGGENATVSDQINVLGNHYGSYYLALQYDLPREMTLKAYHQRYFEDKSGMELYNGADGIWGMQVESPNTTWLKNIVFEFITTKHQSGPMHFIEFDHDKYPGLGGGNDDYYNNGEYTTGASYFNRAIGSPLILSPEYNEKGKIGFRNNRINSWHIGAEGEINPQISYRFLLTAMESWGRASMPFLKTKTAVASITEINYTDPRLEGWQFKGAVSFDNGNMLEKNLGFSFSVRKTGVLKLWK
jgi:hypothetical protein